jgi:hypothetical protein
VRTSRKRKPIKHTNTNISSCQLLLIRRSYSIFTNIKQTSKNISRMLVIVKRAAKLGGRSRIFKTCECKLYLPSQVPSLDLLTSFWKKKHLAVKGEGTLNQPLKLHFANLSMKLPYVKCGIFKLLALTIAILNVIKQTSKHMAAILKRTVILNILLAFFNCSF